MPSLGSSSSRARSSTGPDEPHPDPVAVGGDLVGGRTSSAARPASVNQSARGPSTTRRVTSPSLGQLHGHHVDARVRRRGAADREPVAGGERRGSEPGQDVRGAGAQHGRDLDPAARRRGSCAARSVGGPRRRVAPSGTHTTPYGPCVATVDGDRAGRAGERDRHAAARDDLEAAEGHLERGRGLGVAEQPVGQAQRRDVRGPGVADPEGAEARAGRGPARCVSGPGLTTSQRRRLIEATSTNRTRRPGTSRAGGSRSRSQGCSGGAADELPAAGRLARVDAGELAGQRDGPGRDPGARVGAPRHRQPVVGPDQVAEAGREAAERHRPLLGGVGLDDAALPQPGQPADLGEVLAVVGHRDLEATGVGTVPRARLDGAHGPGDPGGIGPGGVDPQQQRCGRPAPGRRRPSGGSSTSSA